MARPTRNEIAAGEAGWDGEADNNFALLVDGPFPIYLAANTGALPAASGYEACLALVGTSANARLYISNGTSWVLYDPKSVYQADSTAADVAALVADFNTLLTNLKNAGLMATS
jgi:hypothetical protein